MKMRLSVAVLAVILGLSVCAVADINDLGAPSQFSDPSQFQVEYLGNFYCQSPNGSFCPDFADWGGTSAGYIQFDAPGGGIDAYLWDDGTGFLTFASGVALTPPPSGLPLLGIVTEDGTLQQVNQFFPGGVQRPLFVESPVVPEPSTLLLFGPAALFLFGWTRRFWRG
jgi:hypothetical protein